MLKKNPSVVETMKRLRRYVGNIGDWNMSDEDRLLFNENAAKVREQADIIYNNFKVISDNYLIYYLFIIKFVFLNLR